jgi:copper transport protein
VWVVRGRRDELRSVLGWIRLAGLAVATGGIVELAALQAASGVGAGELVDTKAGLAGVLKTIGGLAAWFGFPERAGRLVAPQRSLSSAVATDLQVEGTTNAPMDATAHRWMPVGAATVGLAGYAIVLASFWLDGHTVSRGPWAIHSFVNLVHLGAAAVWGGGVFAMTTVAWMRRRRSEQPGLAEMVVRFSGLATWSLAAVVAAGVAMAALILESPGDLTSTEWGRVLLLKVCAVSVAAGLGAYNHVRLRPALERSPGDPTLARELRTTLAVESAVLACVVVLTAWLVAAAV